MTRGPEARMGTRSRRTIRRSAIAIIVAAGLAFPMFAKAEDPPLVEWSALLPGLTEGYDPTSENECKKGHENCVHAVIREMTKRFDRLGCDFDAAFSLAYLRTTEEYHRFWHEDRFAEPNWLNHYDAVFGEYYFRAIDDWHNGNQSAVPEAWRIAFDSSDKKSVSGYGSLFLGMNAHINRDLPYVLAGIGMVSPDGTSRKGDHDTVNQFLNRVADDLIPELARRFDPTIDDNSIEQTTLEDFASFQAIPGWREMAWRNAEALVDAPDAAARALVEQNIETYAASVAKTIKAATSYGFLSPNGPNSSARDAYCAAHYND
ncbi:MAG: DUF5995 family protein [Actinomycetota bacterium]